ncbi:MAG TPA: SUF system NifU family Fe-S cluster assembly protein [Fimbriimonadaceae bacterium]|nr:SUF system NifU family Fe-S cluster assembly protein [Fimbriimonadaceae bacterium]
MTLDLRELYQEVILDHHKHPRNRGPLADATSTADGHNPLCGDTITVYVKTNGGIVDRVSFEGSGCAISTASASMMTEALHGKSLAEVEELFRQFQDLVTADGPAPTDASLESELGDLEVLAGVREHPVRIKCATLPWHTMRAALKGAHEPVTTE